MQQERPRGTAGDLRDEGFALGAGRADDYVMPFVDRAAGAGEFSIPRPDLKVGFILWPHFTMLAFSCFVEPLRLVADIGDRSRQIRCTWQVMATADEPVEASCGLRVHPTSGLRPPREFDYIVVVGGLMTWLPRGSRKLLAYLRRAAEAGVPLVGLCTGSFILAEAGLLNGRRACVHSFHHKAFVERFPDIRAVTDEIFVIDGDRITCSGGIASLDLATHLIALRCGQECAMKVAYSTSADGTRGPLATQRGLFYDYERIADRRVRRAVLLMEQHLAAPLKVEELAARVNYSQRQLERAFQGAFGATPSAFYRSLRLKFGHWMLRKSHSPVMQIAFECGFADASHFIRCFRVEFGQTPQALRAQAAREQAGS